MSDPTQTRRGPDVRGSGFAYSNPSHSRVGLHLSQTRRTGAQSRVMEAPDATPRRGSNGDAWAVYPVLEKSGRRCCIAQELRSW